MTAARPRLGSWVLLAAAVAGVVGILAYVLRPARVEVQILDGDAMAARPPERPTLPTPWDGTKSGGTFGGRVIDRDGRPIAGADVLLVGIDKDAKASVAGVDLDGTVQSIDIPVFGDYRTAAHARTDTEGRFSMAAGDSQIVAIFAYLRGYSPGLLAHMKERPLAPGPGHEIRLAASGWLKGKVEDAVTKAPVVGADVAVYLQSVVSHGAPGPAPFTATSAFAIFTTYVGRELGPLVWGIKAPDGDTGFHMRTAADGTFLFGPIMEEVQVEVVITHPDYLWTDMDGEIVFPSDNTDPMKAPVSRRLRSVIPAGETVERTFPLSKGKEIAGRVLDGDGKPIPDVTVSLEHVAQYAQHVWYRTHARLAITDAKGRFRIAGLSYEPYNLQMTHPSIDNEYFSGVKAGSDVDYKIQGSGGWIDLGVEGGPTDGRPLGVRVILEPADGKSARREESQILREGKLTVERVRAGRYDLTVTSGTRISEPASIEVRASEGATALARLTAGGSVRVPVRDANGRPIDPATVELEGIRGEGTLRRAAVLVVRQGEAYAEGLLAGRYRAKARALGYVPGESEAFEVRTEQTTTVAPVVLRRQGYVRVTGVVGEDGKAVAVDVHMSLKQGDGDFEPVKVVDAGLLPLRPGSVTIRVEATDGRRFEKTLEIGDGDTVPLEIRLSP